MVYLSCSCVETIILGNKELDYGESRATLHCLKQYSPNHQTIIGDFM